MSWNKRLRSTTAVTGLLAVAIFGVWFVAMLCLTVVTAQEIYDDLYEKSQDFADEVSRSGMLPDFYDRDFSRYGLQYEKPSFLQYLMLRAISMNTTASCRSEGHYGDGERSKLIRDIEYPMEAAVLFYDAEGRLLYSSADNIMFFDYYTQAEWDAGMDTTAGLHYGWIDISQRKDAAEGREDPYLRFRNMFAQSGNLREIAAIRVTGFFEGMELHPIVMHEVTEAQIRQVLESTSQFSTGEGSYSYIISDLERTGELEWQLQFDHRAEYAGDGLVTVYITDADMWDAAATALNNQGKEYASLADLTKELDLPLQDSSVLRDKSIFQLNELLVFSRWIGADFSSAEYLNSGETTIDFYLIAALRSNPLACAVRALRNIYFVTGVPALILLLIVRSRIRERLLQPVADIANAMAENWKEIYRAEGLPTMWLEAEKLDTCFRQEQDRRRMKDQEIIRLRTALEYAETAELNRRQMTSNIAHELKTPLAVIHSYAQGLKEHIAEEKRDKYIDVILSEVERTDAMVLEMLDLSRLEAGKVKLSRDVFSLCALTRAVFAKLEIALQAKGLRIDFLLPEECQIVADESRMGQVIENFATNAIKYTAAGGHIQVKIRKNGREGALFTIENESAPLSAEALEKVWDTFYRDDRARTGSGSGLGLAIAKSIIELHGGRCFVRNTKDGVEFGFSL